MRVGEKIRRHLLARNIPGKCVADRLGVPPTTFLTWMQGKCDLPVNAYASICEILGVPFEEFLDHKAGNVPVVVESGGEHYVKLRMDVMLRRDLFDCAVDAAVEMGYQKAEHLIGSVLHIGLQGYFAEQLQKQLEGYRAWDAHRFRQEVMADGNRA